MGHDEEPERPLRRMPTSHSVIGGVCSGLAYYLGTPTFMIRLSMLLLFFAGVGLTVYILLWIVLPNWEKVPEDFSKVTGD